MKTTLVGYDDGTKSYLGRQENAKKGEDSLAEAILRKWNLMKSIRQKTERLRWEACAMVNHRIDEFSLGKSPVQAVKLYNTAGIEAFETFINGYHGNLISPGMLWLALTMRGENYEDSDTITGLNDYLELLEESLYNEFKNSNFYPLDKLATKDAAVQGTSAEFILDDVERGICIYDTLPPWDFWIDNNSKGQVDTLFYRYYLTAEQAEERFGDKLPYEIKRDLENGNADAEHEFLLAIYPRRTLRDDRGKILPASKKPFAAVTYCSTADAVIDESGYDTFPVAVHIWEPGGDSVYGIGIVMRYIAELKRLNSMSKESLVGIQKLTSPAMAVPEMLKGRFSSNPGAVNYIGNTENIPKVIQTVQDVGWVSQEIRELEDKIKRLFFNNLFNYLMQQDKVLTATQVQAIKSEELVLLSSILGTTQYMKITPIVKRTLNIMAKGGRIPPPPKELVRKKNGLMKIELNGPLARSLKAYTMQDGLTTSLELLQQLKALQLEHTFDNVKLDDYVRKLFVGAGMPQSLIEELVTRDKKRQQKQQMIAQQQQMEQAQKQSEIVRNLGGRGNMNNAGGMN